MERREGDLVLMRFRKDDRCFAVKMGESDRVLLSLREAIAFGLSVEESDRCLSLSVRGDRFPSKNLLKKCFHGSIRT